MRSLHVIPAVAERYGGPSRAIVDMCRALLARGVQICVATTDADGARRLSVPLEKAIDHQGVETIFFSRQYSEAFKYSRPLARWLRSSAQAFDVVHIHAVFSHASLAAARSARGAGVPYIVRPLGSLAPWAMRHKPWRKRVLWQFGVRSMLRDAAAIHCTSMAEERQIVSLLGPSKTAVVPLGVDWQPSRVSNANGDARIADTWRPYVLALGRLHPVKGLDLLIRAFLEVVRRRDCCDWRLVIAGDGDPGYVDQLKRLAAERGGNGRVIFPGWLQGQAKEIALQQAGFVAVPSHQESFGLTVFEALGQGVPVVVSRNIDIADLISEAGAGWVCDLEEQALAASLQEAIIGSGERIERGHRGRMLVESTYAWPIVAGQLEKLYRDVCDRG